MAASAVTRRLPGVAFEAQPPPSPRVLPRMDVAAFVGFAAAGPLDIPVAVDDAESFAAVFGDDAPLAWDEARGEPLLAQLAPAVRAFFRNGGRRAWIVRVAAETATRSVLPVPGLVERAPGGAPRLATLSARARGSWTDGLRAGAALSSTPAVLLGADTAALAFELEAGAARIVPGDLVRIRSGRFTLLFGVDTVTVTPAPAGAPALPGRTVLTVTGAPGSELWLEHIAAPAGATGEARYLDLGGRELVASATVPIPDGSPPASPPDAAETLVLELGTAVASPPESPPDPGSLAATAPEPGALVQVEGLSPGRTLWLHVETLGEGTDGILRVAGRPSWVLAAPPAAPPAFDAGATVEQLALELWVRRDEDERFVLGDLGLAPSHPRYLGDLPTDEQLFTPRDSLLGPDPLLWADAADPRFPLAGGGGRVFYPLGVGVLPDTFLGPLHAPEPPLERDGLADFGDALFLDDRLRATGVSALVGEADYVRWQSPSPRRLTGIHALLEIEEATLVAVPDAIHRGWRRAPVAAVPPAPPSVGSPPASPPDMPEEFTDCALHELLPTPQLTLRPRDQGGSFGLSWTAVDEPGARYVLQEGTDPRDWDDARTLATGARRSIQLYGRTTGTHFYRVRAEAGPNVSAWSEGLAVGAPIGTGYVLEREQDYRPDVLLALQRALLRMCAARGDLLALLSAPESYRGDAAIAHARRLRAAVDPRQAGPPAPPAALDVVQPLDASEQRALGFGAFYHPWLVLSLPGRGEALRAVAPDGTAAGVMARRAATRGAWIAPANDPFADVVALVRPEPATALAALQEAQVNELRHDPGGFLCMAQDTLIRDEDLRPVNVRRLLALVRRLVLLEGSRFVFEPNDPTFRRGVERGFADVMGLLHRLGAFAGRTPEQAYRVSVGNPPNTPQSIDQGRLIVEIALAPSRPLTFLLVRLIHSGDRGFQIETP